MKVYIAGALFTEGDRYILEKIDSYLRSQSVDTFLPHRDIGFSEDTESIYLGDLEMLHSCDAVVALLHGPDIDSGTAWEIGYARARGLKVFGIIDDVRIPNPHTQMNVMIAHSVEVVPSFDHLRDRLISLGNGKALHNGKGLHKE